MQPKHYIHSYNMQQKILVLSLIKTLPAYRDECKSFSCFISFKYLKPMKVKPTSHHRLNIKVYDYSMHTK